MSEIEISFKTSEYAHYSQYIKGILPIKRLYIKADDLIEGVDISITSNPQFLLNYELNNETLPRRSKVRFDVSAMLSPIFLSSLDTNIDGNIIVSITKDGKELASETSPIRLLSYNTLHYSDEPELLATHIHRSALTSEIIEKSRVILSQWKKRDNIDGYRDSTKNDVRFAFASIYKALIDYNFAKCDSEDGDEVLLPSHEDIASTNKLTSLSLALLMASTLESMHLNSVIAKSGDDFLVGVWLREECFPDINIEDSEFLTKRMAVGVTDLSMVSISDIFRRVAFESSEKRSANSLKRAFDFAIDVKRARIGHIYPLPTRVRRDGGYDLIKEDIYDTEVVPRDIEEYKGSIGENGTITKEKQWERRLLDLSMRNALLNFRENRNSIKVIFSSIAEFISRFDENKSYSILPLPSGIDSLEPFVGRLTLSPAIDLLNIEMNNAKLHANISGEDYDKTMINVYRKDKVFMEESGTNSLYLAVGFLRYKGESDKDVKYAPIFLYPVKLIHKNGNKESYAIKAEGDEIRINSTLLEYLYEEFGLDLRGLSNVDLDGEAMLSIIGRIRREIVDKASWDITDDIYLTNVSFANYLMWNDVRNRIDDFRENRLIRGFMDNSTRVFDKDDYILTDAPSDDTYNSDGIYLPMSADSSQYSAIRDSLSKSFVLHGPPGTGKSQTITNIIANNILAGRRVLFVAEKMAALSVVEKRLDEIGLGDFCLELHSNKNNKNDVVKKLVNTMSLSSAKVEADYTARASEIRTLIESIDKSMQALHRPRKLGVSVYEGAMRYLENSDAVASLKIEPIFYERLTKESLKKYEDILSELVSVGKECGQITSSPFRYVGDVVLDDEFRARAMEIIDILTLEIEHMRDYARRLMDILRVRTTIINGLRLDAMYDICMLISGNSAIASYFANKDKYDNPYAIIMSFKANNTRKQELLGECLRVYDHIPDDLPIDALIGDDERRRARAVKKTKRMMSRLIISNSNNAEDEGVELLSRLFAVDRDIENIKDDISKIFDNKGDIYDNVGAIDRLFESARVLYADFKQESFESIIESILEGRYMVSHFAMQYDSYTSALAEFRELFDYRLDTAKVDISDLASYIKHLRANIDMMPNWCKYNKLLNDTKDMGLQFIVTPLKSGTLSINEILSSFRKCVYGNFVESELTLDKTLSQFSGKTIEERIDKLKMLSDSYEELTREEMYYRMVSRVPHADKEGAHNLEMVVLNRAEKSNMKGTTLRKLFLDIPTIMKYACPCMLMSPVSVAQYLDMDLEKFDLVVFDEASQMPTAEAIGSIARAMDVIVVGDPKQLPPTKFFNSDFKDEDNMEIEDLESILDDCLALGMPERHLLWHYRSQDESLIAFSNAMYYDNRLLTFPSPMELDSKVKFRYIDGVYERGGTKRNKREAEELVREVITRLRDGKHMSIGIVTFNTAQQNYIDDLLREEIKKNKLYTEAYESDEPIFVKNLENVQGDERDIIFFSVGYGPDASGKLSLNFGPINQSGGYRRLNVAITRARCEMMVFSSILGNMIDLNKTDNDGVKGLKAFLEYAERGRDMLTLDSKSIDKRKRKGIGAYIARDLREKGYECEYDVGVSNFKIDVAVVDPKHKDRYILAIMCDGENANNIGSVRDRMTMNVKILKRLGWNVYYLWTINYLNNSKREIQKIKDYLMTFTSDKTPTKKAMRETVARYKRNYRQHPAKPLAKGSTEYILNDKNYSALQSKVLDVIAVESPIAEDILVDRLINIYNITRNSKRALAVLLDIAKSVAIREEYMGKVFYRIDASEDRDTFRPIDDNRGKREIDEIHPLEIISAMHCVLENRIRLSREDLIRETLDLIKYTRKTKIAPIWVNNAIDIAIEDNSLIESTDSMITM